MGQTYKMTNRIARKERQIVTKDRKIDIQIIKTDRKHAFNNRISIQIGLKIGSSNITTINTNRQNR